MKEPFGLEGATGAPACVRTSVYVQGLIFVAYASVILQNMRICGAVRLRILARFGESFLSWNENADQGTYFQSFFGLAEENLLNIAPQMYQISETLDLEQLAHVLQNMCTNKCMLTPKYASRCVGCRGKT